MVRHGSSCGLMRKDLDDIERCDALIAYLPKLSGATCIKLFYAKVKKKKTICICQFENSIPWIMFHSDIVLKNIEDLEKAFS